MRERIIHMCNGIPVPALIEFVQKGTVTLDDLIMGGLSPSRLKQVEIGVNKAEETMWKAALTGTVANVLEYIKAYPNGSHVLEGRDLILSKEPEFWASIQTDGTAEAMNRYLAIFPQGPHADEANA
ncbi:MAG: hypothetical protein IK092_07240, partial [Muribaculaceae bacterium]|nr:hypothetical protein [Muribaculaceae bacterium]